MIRYALACEHDHPFEAWFASSGDYDDQARRGLVECPMCGSSSVRKQIMAPALAGTRRRDEAAPTPESQAQMRSMMMQAMGEVRRHVKETFDYVGDRFAQEARDIHEGVSEARGIYGEASPKEVKALAEDGIKVAPLPPAPKPKAELN
jgi:hypothetical protein